MANEKRLIDANALMIKIAKKYQNGARDSGLICYDSVMAAISDAPDVDAVEVVHGRWMWEGRFKACSVCGTHIDMQDTLGASFWKYCPNCGAKMDGGNEDG